ncbi:ABC transporter substrate-binding protein [Rhodobacter sp. SGA-6-6]|uniref:ABC transporter substrate-binding protein n=1 Tax=Rhodobacter sp. SGA-6-6 TaxID=2710882 RepID=UPI0013E9F764|nr:ABC transporter substrate-binding protein [Rhodobacter sp. SGA-6-6]NGM46236.1 ABC transporter substrate-binding protein [Rhodobacter sp. SGA-6-6]
MKRILLASAAALALTPGLAAACEITVGLVLELTGPAGEYGQASAKSVEMAFRDLNEAGGVAGCTLKTDTRDSQTQANVAVDAATQLVQVEKVPAIIGGVISPMSIPILTSVTAPAGVLQVSPASSSPTLTALGREGKTGGVFFRTITSDALQGVAAAQFAIDRGFKKIAIIHQNNDFGVNMVKEFSDPFTAMGGTVVSVTPYNGKQSSYASEVTAAMAAGEIDALYLVSDPVDGATIARTWISQGGVQKFLLNDGMNSEDFIGAVGKEYLGEAFGTSSGTDPTASTEYFNANYKDFSGIDPAAPAADRSYDAGALVGLAIAIAGGPDRAKLPDALRAAVDPAGEPIYAGKEEFAKALALIAEGKPIRYEGVIGPVHFDDYGDIAGPFRLWQIVDGVVTTVGEMSTDDIEAVKAKIK